MKELLDTKQPGTGEEPVRYGGVEVMPGPYPIPDAGAPLLEAAQQSGEVRRDFTIDDLLRLAFAIASGDFPRATQRDHVLGVALDGLTVTR